MNNLYNANQLIEKCNKTKEIWPEMEPFLNSVIAVITDLIAENGKLSKDYYLQKTELETAKKSMERLQKRSAMIMTWFGPDVIKVVDLAADIATERYKK